MAEAREELVYLAKLAEKAERYDEMVEFMEKLVVALPEAEELTVEERNLLSMAYKNVISSRRSSWRIVSSIEQKEVESHGEEWERLIAIRDYRARIESELSSICEMILRLLDTRLFPSATTDDSKVFFLKMKGDYHRYLAEFLIGDPRKEAADSTLAAYKAAQEIAVEKLGPAHPVRLGVALNFSVFYFEILNSYDRACTLAKEAFEEAIGDLDSLGEESYKDSTLVMQLLRDNLTLWNADMKDDIAEETRLLSPYGDGRLFARNPEDLRGPLFAAPPCRLSVIAGTISMDMDPINIVPWSFLSSLAGNGLPSASWTT